jgi:hypothetical protein
MYGGFYICKTFNIAILKKTESNNDIKVGYALSLGWSQSEEMLID